MHPFAPRRIEFHGLRSSGGWRLKLYSILYGPGPLDWDSFAPGVAMAESTLPQPAVTPERPGTGFLIAHQGRTRSYAVLGWWDRENELPLRVFVSPDGRPQSWRPSEGSESICVWDLEVLWAEREAYAATVLSPSGSDVAGYLARVMATDDGPGSGERERRGAPGPR
jgi:hypothetical protein